MQPFYIILTTEGKRLDNGTIREITGFTNEGDLIVKAGRNGKEQAVISRDYGNLAHGYTVTSYASQGLTVDKVLIAQSTQSFPASSREQWYVSLSRGRESIKIYTDDKAELMEQVKQSDHALSATELTQKKDQEPANQSQEFRFSPHYLMVAAMRKRNHQLMQSQSRQLVR